MIYNFTTDKEEIMKMVEGHQYWEHQKIVFTNGCFDVFHAGHVDLLNESKKLGDILIVGINSDESVKLLKGETRPINNIEDRVYVLSSIKPVDHIIIFNEYSVLELIKFIQPNVITKGGDYTPEQLAADGGDFMKEIGGEMVIIPMTKIVSTSQLIQKYKIN